MPNNMATRYAEAMQDHSYGHGLYTPEPMEILKPGSCGYLDDRGRWQPVIYDITDQASLKAKGFKAPSGLARIPSRTHTWGPKKSTSVSCTKPAITAGVSALPAAIPVGASIVLDFQTSSNFGAVLHCPQTVVEEGYFHRNPFLDWAKSNAAAILSSQPEVKSTLCG